MSPSPANPIVHLELHTGNLGRACAFYAQLFGWGTATIHVGAKSYHALDFGDSLQGGVTECGIEQPLWLPYAEVGDIRRATGLARLLGATVTLEPREGPVGWRSVLNVRSGGEIALWQPKAPPLRMASVPSGDHRDECQPSPEQRRQEGE